MAGLSTAVEPACSSTDLSATTIATSTSRDVMTPTREQILAASAGWVAVVPNLVLLQKHRTSWLWLQSPQRRLALPSSALQRG